MWAAEAEGGPPGAERKGFGSRGLLTAEAVGGHGGSRVFGSTSRKRTEQAQGGASRGPRQRRPQGRSSQGPQGSSLSLAHGATAQADVPESGGSSRGHFGEQPEVAPSFVSRTTPGGEEPESGGSKAPQGGRVATAKDPSPPRTGKRRASGANRAAECETEAHLAHGPSAVVGRRKPNDSGRRRPEGPHQSSRTSQDD